MKSMRASTLETLGLGSAMDVFKRGRMPAAADDLVGQIFGPPNRRGSMVISGANGIVGAGKTMQLGSRLQSFGVRMVALDFPSAPDGIGRQYPGLQRAFGTERAAEIMANTIRLSYGGRELPAQLLDLQPRFLLEAIPEILEVKRNHYELFREAFSDIEIRSVTSGFPSSALGVGIAHPAFPHEINKIWEVVEPAPYRVSQLLWSLGLIPVPVSDHWSFVLDVLFCGLTLAALRYHGASNVPFWKIDKYARRLIGANPFRAHDAIGAKGANFLTWSCLHHLSEQYGELFTPAAELVERKESGQDWYPPNHFRPLVNWQLSDEDDDTFTTWLLGPMIQMTSLMLHENRAHLTHMNAIGELCAQFRRGILAVIRDLGVDASVRRVEAYHALHPEAGRKSWYPDALGRMEEAEGLQLYVNAEHDGNVGVISISRESYNSDVDAELNRAIDWLKAEGIDRVIVTGDFHLSTQMVGADTSEFFPALSDVASGTAIATAWSRTARRLHSEFARSVGFPHGKRCLGGMLELMMHCHYLVCAEEMQLGMPEVTLPVVPGMEGCHWSFRKARSEHWPKLLHMLLTGRARAAAETVGWLADFAGPFTEALTVAWKITTEGDHGVPARSLQEGVLKGVPSDGRLPESSSAATDAARKAIIDCVQGSCGVGLGDALATQARHSAEFMSSPHCQKGRIGAEAARVLNA